MPVRSAARTWRRFGRVERQRIELQLAIWGEARCPCCGGLLAERPNTRLAAVLPSGAGGLDLECRGCRRFHARVQHTARSLYLRRLQRLAAAVLRA